LKRGVQSARKTTLATHYGKNRSKSREELVLFIASHCAAALLRHGYCVRALDNLDPQINGAERTPPGYLDRSV
jgi:hypothetical protein